MRVLSIGECMIELSHRAAAVLSLGYAGDTFNTAAYLARLTPPEQVEVAYLTRVGDDHYSARLLEAISSEGIDTALVSRVAGRSPGLYLVHTDEHGERHFTYYRDRAPARELFDDGEVPAIQDYDIVYLSAITLQILSDRGRDRLLTSLSSLRDRGGQVVFDSNYRQRGWADVDTARRVIRDATSLATTALPSFSDERDLHGDRSMRDTVDRLSRLGVPEIVVKSGEHGCAVRDGGQVHVIPAERVDRVVDSSAAGDSFNAGYLAARIDGCPPLDAAHRGQRLAARVVQHRGAILDNTLLARRTAAGVRGHR